MSKPIVLVPLHEAVVPEDIAALQEAGILVLRCQDPSTVRVLSTESVVADGFVFRAMLHMFENMRDGYGSFEQNKVVFANAVVAYAREALVDTQGGAADA